MDLSIAGLISYVKPRRREIALWGTAAVILLVAAGAGIGLVKTTQRKMTQIQQQIEYEKKRNEILGKLRNIYTEYERYQSRLPPTPEPAWLSRHITELANSAGLELHSIEPEKLPPSEEFQSMVVKISLECGYHQLGSFVEKIENSPFFLRIEELSLEKIPIEEVQPSQSPVGKGKVEMRVHTFLLKEP